MKIDKKLSQKEPIKINMEGETLNGEVFFNSGSDMIRFLSLLRKDAVLRKQEKAFSIRQIGKWTSWDWHVFIIDMYDELNKMVFNAALVFMVLFVIVGGDASVNIHWENISHFFSSLKKLI